MFRQMRRELSPTFRVRLASNEEQIKTLIDDPDVHGIVFDLDIVEERAAEAIEALQEIRRLRDDLILVRLLCQLRFFEKVLNGRRKRPEAVIAVLRQDLDAIALRVKFGLFLQAAGRRRGSVFPNGKADPFCALPPLQIIGAFRTPQSGRMQPFAETRPGNTEGLGES
jgi:hypothetical protein